MIDIDSNIKSDKSKDAGEQKNLVQPAVYKDFQTVCKSTHSCVSSPKECQTGWKDLINSLFVNKAYPSNILISAPRF